MFMIQTLFTYLARFRFCNKILVFILLFSFAMAFDFKMKTNVVFHEKKFEWKINNFSKLPNQVKSLPFFPIIGSPSQWQVLLLFDNSYLSYDKGIKVHLRKIDREEAVPQMNVTGKISFKNSKGELWKERNFTVIMHDKEDVLCWNVGVTDPKHLCSLFDFNDDIFIIEWSMTVFDIVTSFVTPPSILIRIENEEVNMNSTLKEIYKKNAFTDFTFQFSTEIIRAHKAVLSVRSPVLEKMFERDTSEKQTNSVTIEDIEFRVFDCFIGYICTNEIREEIKADVEALLALYEVADKYEVTDLQKRCADVLISDFLNVNTVCKILQMADMHHDEYFKEATMQFFRLRFLEVTKTPEWSHFVNENVELASEIRAFVTEVVNKAPN